MSTASVLLTVATTWGTVCGRVERNNEKGLQRNIAEVALRELRETPVTREQSLRIMREWIQKNGDIRNVRQDEAFLLRFLRQKKFSIPMAQQTLLKYLNLKKYYMEYFSNLDCEEAKLAEIINDGYIAISPMRDVNGRRVIVYNMGKFNTDKYNCWDMVRAHMVVYESLLDDPVDQVCGYIHIGDGGEVSAAHVVAWNPSDFARIIKWGEQSVPMRHKEFHIVNTPAAFKYIIDFAITRITPKMAKRINIYSNIKQLHKVVDVSCLPTNYGGPIPLEEMISFTKQVLRERRQKVLSLDQMEILSSKGIITTRSKSINKDLESVQGSFRKLEID